MHVLRREPSGIPVLDEMINDGFPRPSCIGILGDPGSGKTILCHQIVWNFLQRDFSVLYYCVDESAEDLRAYMKLFGWDILPYEKRGKITFYDVFTQGMDVIRKTKDDITFEPDRVANVSYNFREMILAFEYYFEAAAEKNLLVAFDSLSPMFSSGESGKALNFLRSMRYASRVGRAIVIATLQLGVHGENIERAVQSLADGAIELSMNVDRGAVKRFFRVIKMSKTKIYEGYYPMEITDRGIIIHKIPVALEELAK